jgi:hypothetical protein
MENIINYRRFIEALDHYENLGYTYTDVDWTVYPDISVHTKPEHHKDFFVEDKVLVASGEQSFLQKIEDEDLPKGRYCAITPCFRDDIEDSLHGKYFMKLELIETKDVNGVILHSMVTDAFNFFKNYINCKIVKNYDGSIDIVGMVKDKECELGSYGIRTFKDNAYIYGTGLAEPRLGKLIELCK